MNKHDRLSRLLIFCDKSAFIFGAVAGISILLENFFEAQTVSSVVAHVVAIPLRVFLLVALGCTETCPLVKVMLLSMKREYEDAKSRRRWELLEKISLNFKGLESHSNNDDLRENIVEAIRHEMENDVKVGVQVLTMWEQAKRRLTLEHPNH